MPDEIVLRPYQAEAVQAVHDRLADEDSISRPAISIPTGGGKTLIFSRIVRDRGYPALILAHRDELIEQAVEKYEQIDPSTMVGIVKAQRNDIGHPVIVASVQTLARQNRLEQMPKDFRSVIVDECHHVAHGNSYSRVLDYFADVPLILGVSATLERSDKKASGVWEEIVYQKTMLDLIAAGYLSDIRAKGIKLAAADFNGLRVVRGDFKDDELAQMLHDAHAPEIVAKAYLEHAPGRKALVFTPTIELAQEMAAAFRTVGVSAEAAWGTMGYDERKATLKRLAKGETMVVCNAALLTEGYDEPSIDCIVIARPTRSKSYLTQMIGRGTRLYPGKKDLLVLDVVGAEKRIDLMSVPKLFGLKEGDAEEQGVAAKIQQNAIDFGIGARKKAGLFTGSVELESHDIDLFSRAAINWLHLSDGRWMLGLADLGNLFLEPMEVDRWHAVVRRGRADPPTFLGTDPHDLTTAMAIAEEYVRRQGNAASVLIDRAARWRQDPASPSQKNALRRWGIAFDDNISKGDASDLLGAVIATKGSREHVGSS
jgi:ATP-dependent helicase IRC3